MIKKQPDREIDCDKLVQYFQARYNSLKESNWAFVANLEKMKDIVDRRKENAEARGDDTGTGTTITDDAAINDATMVDDAQWETWQRDPELKKISRENSRACLWRNLATGITGNSTQNSDVTFRMRE